MTTLKLKRPIVARPDQLWALPEPKFWMVWLHRSQWSKKLYHDLAEATSDCHRVADLNPGKKVFVVEAIGFTKHESNTTGEVSSRAQNKAPEGIAPGGALE